MNFQLLQKLIGQGTENVFFSGASIQSAILPALLGAKGETRIDLAKLLGYKPEVTTDEIVQRMIFLQELFATTQGIKSSSMTRLFLQEDLNLTPEFAAAIAPIIDSVGVEIINDPEAATARINEAVEAATEGMIKGFITQDMIDNLTTLIIVNAVYMKGEWQLTFDEEETDVCPFETVTGPVNADMMHIHTYLHYAQTEYSQIVKIPYKGRKAYMVIVLPTQMDYGASLAELQDQWPTLSGKIFAKSVQLSLPKFEFGFKMNNISDLLAEIGGETPFTPGIADLSGIYGIEGDWIQRVVHQARISVNEEGSIAAAATATMVYNFSSISDEPDPVVNCDHPFFFFIQREGEMLFSGFVADPSKN